MNVGTIEIIVVAMIIVGIVSMEIRLLVIILIIAFAASSAARAAGFSEVCILGAGTCLVHTPLNLQPN